MYNGLAPQNVLKNYILNKDFLKLSNFKLYDFYSLLLFFTLGLRYLLRLRFNNDHLYFSYRQLYIEEVLMFVRFIFFL